jgi:hypothetical protein
LDEKLKKEAFASFFVSETQKEEALRYNFLEHLASEILILDICKILSKPHHEIQKNFIKT